MSFLVSCRTVELLESSAALQQKDRRCDGAGDAHIALARYLPRGAHCSSCTQPAERL